MIVRSLMMGMVLMGCAASSTATTQDAAVRDVVIDRSCTGRRAPSSVVGVDPATGCPQSVGVEVGLTSAGQCVRIEPSCDYPAACRFAVDLAVTSSPVCGRVDRTRYNACRCEFGVVECPGDGEGFGSWPGCTANNLICDRCR